MSSEGRGFFNRKPRSGSSASSTNSSTSSTAAASPTNPDSNVSRGRQTSQSKDGNRNRSTSPPKAAGGVQHPRHIDLPDRRPSHEMLLASSMNTSTPGVMSPAIVLERPLSEQSLPPVPLDASQPPTPIMEELDSPLSSQDQSPRKSVMQTIKSSGSLLLSKAGIKKNRKRSKSESRILDPATPTTPTATTDTQQEFDPFLLHDPIQRSLTVDTTNVTNTSIATLRDWIRFGPRDATTKQASRPVSLSLATQRPDVDVLPDGSTQAGTFLKWLRKAQSGSSATGLATGDQQLPDGKATMTSKSTSALGEGLQGDGRRRLSLGSLVIPKTFEEEKQLRLLDLKIGPPKRGDLTLLDPFATTNLHHHDHARRILDLPLAEAIRVFLPPIEQEVLTWNMLYTLERDGAAISTVYRRCVESGPLVLAILDSEGHVFGAYLNESLRLKVGYYGNGTCFLWKKLDEDPHREADEPTTTAPSATAEEEEQRANDHHHQQRRHHHHQHPHHHDHHKGHHHERRPRPPIKVYKASAKNTYYMLCQNDEIALGGGKGKFGLFLDDSLLHGYSDNCETFENEVLAGAQNAFECVGLEIWQVVHH